MLKKIVILLILLTWPLALLHANTLPNFIHYIFPALLILMSYLLFKKNNNYSSVPLFIIPFIEPKLAILPLIFLLINFDRKNIKSQMKKNFSVVVLAIILLVIFWRPFFGQTILTSDYEAQQQILQKQNLYHSIPLARIYQNKIRIPLTKFIDHGISFLDPNNYFFGFAPRQITIDNQNLKKFPFLSLPFLLLGLFHINKNKYNKFIITILIASLINLSLLTVFDRNDFILWIPLSLLIIDGLTYVKSKWYYLLFIVFAIPEVLRTII